MSYKPPIEATVRTVCEELADTMEKDIANYASKIILELGLTVDKNELIRALQYDREQYDMGYYDGRRDAMNAMNAMKWISVEERLPPLDENVLVLVKGASRYIWWLTRLDPTTADVVWEAEDGSCEEEVSIVTHWMPLPDPPEVKE